MPRAEFLPSLVNYHRHNGLAEIFVCRWARSERDGALEPQRHRRFDDDMFPGPGTGDNMLGGAFRSGAGSQPGRRPAGPEIVDVVAGRDAEIRGDGVGARANRIADRNKTARSI